VAIRTLPLVSPKNFLGSGSAKSFFISRHRDFFSGHVPLGRKLFALSFFSCNPSYSASSMAWYPVEHNDCNLYCLGGLRLYETILTGTSLLDFDSVVLLALIFFWHFLLFSTGLHRVIPPPPPPKHNLKPLTIFLFSFFCRDLL